MSIKRKLRKLYVQVVGSSALRENTHLRTHRHIQLAHVHSYRTTQENEIARFSGVEGVVSLAVDQDVEEDSPRLV